MMPPDQLITPDFTLRGYCAGDGTLFADAVNSSLEHLNPFLGWARQPVTPAEAEEKVRRFAAGYLKGEDFLLGIGSLQQLQQIDEDGLANGDAGAEAQPA